MTLIASKLDAIAALPGAMLAWDGCHKIYVCTTPAAVREAMQYGYESDDFSPASDIHRLWERSCGLRFVSAIELTTTPWTIRQFEDDPGEEDT